MGPYTKQPFSLLPSSCPAENDQRQHSFSLLATLPSIGEQLKLLEGQYPLVHPETPRVLPLLPGNDPPTQGSTRPHRHRMALPFVPPDGIHEEQVASNDFQGLHAEVRVGCTQLRYSGMELRQQLLMDIARIILDQPSMETLEASVSDRVGRGQGLPKPSQPHLPQLCLSWDRPCAVVDR